MINYQGRLKYKIKKNGNDSKNNTLYLLFSPNFKCVLSFLLLTMSPILEFSIISTQFLLKITVITK